MWFLSLLRSMINHSKQWAQARGLLEVNPVHGEEEWRIPLKRRFASTRTTGFRTSETANAVVQDGARLNSRRDTAWTGRDSSDHGVWP